MRRRSGNSAQEPVEGRRPAAAAAVAVAAAAATALAKQLTASTDRGELGCDAAEAAEAVAVAAAAATTAKGLKRRQQRRWL